MLRMTSVFPDGETQYPELIELNSPVAMIKMLEIDEIRKKQLAKGDFDCFGRASTGFCDQFQCAYHANCTNISRLLPELATF